jgi:hypothetical protein
MQPDIQQIQEIRWDFGLEVNKKTLCKKTRWMNEFATA